MTIDERVTQAVEGLRALKIIDEVRSDNPLARDAADLITDLHAALKESERERDEARAENTRLRAALAQSDQPCAYCTLPAAEWAKCQHGFPGCARADDAMGCPELGAGLRADALAADLERAREALMALETACDVRAARTSPPIYNAMIDGGMAEVLSALDDARSAARAFLRQRGEGR